MPVREGAMINWADAGFGVIGTWTSRSPMLADRIFDSEDGYLDWFCYQPASDVRLTVGGHPMEGRGYAEQLIMTIPAWKIPMDELRWGRFGSEEDTLVWIELREKGKKQWLWLNGEKIDDPLINDDRIAIPGRKIFLELDRSVILESERKIQSVVETLIRYIPGFNKVMPLTFLTSHATKWMSHGKLLREGGEKGKGMAIHERVIFKGI